MEEVLKKLFDAVLEGDFEGVKVNLHTALDAKLDPSIILNDGMIAAMREVGCRFEQGEYYVPEMLIAARAMQSGMAILKPNLQQTDRISCGKVVIGTVKGDLHDIGKNLVALMLGALDSKSKTLAWMCRLRIFSVSRKRKSRILSRCPLC